MKGHILQIDRNDSPYNAFPAASSEVVRLIKSRYSRGYYHMESILGYELFQVKNPIEVTSLQVKDHRGWTTLMVDDPLHWLGMGELASLASPGTILVAGLGMGLILYQLVKRQDITSIKVVEIDAELIGFIRPYLPADTRIEICERDFFSYIQTTADMFDTAILDLWVIKGNSAKRERQQVAASMGIARALTTAHAKRVLIWGLRGY